MSKSVYAIQHNITKRIYVGVSGNVEMRIKKHIYALIQHTHTNKEFQADFDRFGADYSFYVLEKGIDDNICDLRERQWMNLLRTNERYRGYNLSPWESYIDDLSSYEKVAIHLEQGDIVDVMKDCDCVVGAVKEDKESVSTIYKRIVEYCKEQKMSICKFEKMCRLSNGQVNGWRKGSSPQVDSLKKIASATETTIGMWL